MYIHMYVTRERAPAEPRGKSTDFGQFNLWETPRLNVFLLLVLCVLIH
jgi:hypothetical protein